MGGWDIYCFICGNTCRSFNKNNINEIKEYVSEYNYLIKQDFIYNDLIKYEYLIYIKSLPVSFNETIWSVTLKHNIDYINEHFINLMIREWLINHIQRESSELNTELFKFFYG